MNSQRSTMMSKPTIPSISSHPKVSRRFLRSKDSYAWSTKSNVFRRRISNYVIKSLKTLRMSLKILVREITLR